MEMSVLWTVLCVLLPMCSLWPSFFLTLIVNLIPGVSRLPPWLSCLYKPQSFHLVFIGPWMFSLPVLPVNRLDMKDFRFENSSSPCFPVNCNNSEVQQGCSVYPVKARTCFKMHSVTLDRLLSYYKIWCACSIEDLIKYIIAYTHTRTVMPKYV